jgi:hypothetical protein
VRSSTSSLAAAELASTSQGPGFALAKGQKSGLVGAKAKRMAFIAANGLLILVPSALFLASKARAGGFDETFYGVRRPAEWNLSTNYASREAGGPAEEGDDASNVLGVSFCSAERKSGTRRSEKPATSDHTISFGCP